MTHYILPSRRYFILLVCCIAWLALETPARCQTDADTPVASADPDVESPPSGPRGVQLGERQRHRLRVGIRIRAGGSCRGIVASVPVPMDWPEQQVQIENEEISSHVKSVKYRNLGEGARQMLVSIPRLNPGQTAEAILTLEITRNVIEGPEGTDAYVIPKPIKRQNRIYLGASPFIESRHRRIRVLAKQILQDKEDLPAWQQVEAIYDYVRENVKYQEAELKGAVETLDDGIGDCEGMTSLFIALCRAAGIPARMVWVTDHSYPEFLLMDESKERHWFPCQISGSHAFGNMPETRPIIQKGDNYRIPETRERRRYVAIQMQAKAVRGSSPQITEIMEFVR